MKNEGHRVSNELRGIFSLVQNTESDKESNVWIMKWYVGFDICYEAHNIFLLSRK